MHESMLAQGSTMGSGQPMPNELTHHERIVTALEHLGATRRMFEHLLGRVTGNEHDPEVRAEKERSRTPALSEVLRVVPDVIHSECSTIEKLVDELNQQLFG